MFNQTHQHQAICQWPAEDRPREKLLKYGEDQLSDSELLAILLRTGVKGTSAVELSRRILQKFKTFRNMSQVSMEDWKEFKGLGSAKLAQIRAALEIGKRFRENEVKETSAQVTNSQHIAHILMPRMRDLTKEIFKIVLLDSHNKIIETHDIEKGTVNHAMPIVREIFEYALKRYAVSLICAHNHPSGEITPSQEDRQFTKRLQEAGRIMNIPLIDHIIIGNNTYYSFADEHQIN